MSLQRVSYPVKSLEPQMLELRGKFVCNDTSNPTTQEGKGVTVTYTATGKWTLTIAGSGTLDIQDVQVLLEKADGNDVILQIDSVDEAARTVVIGAFELTGGAFAALDNTHTIRWKICVKTGKGQ